MEKSINFIISNIINYKLTVAVVGVTTAAIGLVIIITEIGVKTENFAESGKSVMTLRHSHA